MKGLGEAIAAGGGIIMWLWLFNDGRYPDGSETISLIIGVAMLLGGITMYRKYPKEKFIPFRFFSALTVTLGSVIFLDGFATMDNPFYEHNVKPLADYSDETVMMLGVVLIIGGLLIFFQNEIKAKIGSKDF